MKNARSLTARINRACAVCAEITAISQAFDELRKHESWVRNHCDPNDKFRATVGMHKGILFDRKALSAYRDAFLIAAHEQTALPDPRWFGTDLRFVGAVSPELF